LRVLVLERRDAPAAGFFRVVSYNVASDAGAPRPGLGTLLQGIGSEVVAGRAEPIDLLAMQEVDMQTTTTQDVVNILNGIYGSGAYARGAVNGNSTGSGTLGIVYNTQSLQLLGEAAIGTASTSGQPRQSMRYRFQPVGYPASSQFYVYNSHYKADSDSTSQNRRLVEATAIRTDSDALGNVPVLYVGDFNAYNSNEAGYQYLLSAGPGQAFDPINRPGSWHENSTFRDIFSQAPAFNSPSGLTGGGIDDRFDFQLNTSELTDGVGLDYIAGTYHSFGNNGTVAINGSINAASNTALPGLANRLQLLDLLTTVSDHLPVVADYRIVTPPPTVAHIQINDGSAQRSMVTSLAVTFSAPVTFPNGLSAAFELTRTGPGGPTGLVAFSAALFGNSVTLSFTNGGPVGLDAGGSLFDGVYQLRVIGSKVQGDGGFLDGDADGSPGGDLLTPTSPALPGRITRLFGDVDGDGDVDATDFGAFRNAFGTAAVAFDFDGDGDVDATDFGQFRLRSGVSL